jgi:hypothetical protein
LAQLWCESQVVRRWRDILSAPSIRFLEKIALPRVGLAPHPRQKPALGQGAERGAVSVIAAIHEPYQVIGNAGAFCHLRQN